MKYRRIFHIFFITLSFAGISQYSFSQHLKFNDLVALYKGSVAQNDEYLRNKYFVLKSSEKDEINKSTELTWMYNRPGSNSSTSNEYFIKTCASLFKGECDKVTYMTTDANHFTNLKSGMNQSFNKFLFSETNDYGVLSHHYLIPGPIDAIFKTIPRSETVSTSVYVLEFKKMIIQETK